MDFLSFFRLNSNMLNISFEMAGFLINIGRNTQWEYLFSMYFDNIFERLPYFLV